MLTTPMRFAATGAAGFIFPRHLEAIQHVGGTLVAVLDPHSSVGILDRYGFTSTKYFASPEQFSRDLTKRKQADEGINYLSVCSPNHLHDAHCRMGMDSGADIICEKPLVVKPHNLDQLRRYEDERQRRVYALLQMRYHAEAQRMREVGATGFHCVRLNYVTPRGDWYLQTWKNHPQESGGLIMNIGVHFLDLLISIFGDMQEAYVRTRTERGTSGTLILERALVRWDLSISYDVPRQRVLEVDGVSYDFTTGFDDLHKRVYEDIVAGRGYGIEDARPAISLAHQLYQQPLSPISV